MRIIVASNGKIIKVDPSDFEYLNQFKWHITKNGYAVRNYGGKDRLQKAMHREILNLNDRNQVCDHIDRDKLNNQRNNLRVTSIIENSKNRSSAKNSTSKYLGVSWFKRDKKWISHIKANGKTKHLGVFDDEIKAAMCYDSAAKLLHGDFANLNFK